MKIEKIETNYKRNLYLETKNIKPGSYKETIENQVINIYPNIKAQEFIGFGGAITQSAGVSYQKLPKEKQKSFIIDYFVNCNYSFCRIPIGSCDFSPEMYSYSNRLDLLDFSIEQDEKYFVPLLREILEVNPNLKLLASPWSPPSFMKSNKMLINRRKT